jgi:uncharacterized protein YcnI
MNIAARRVVRGIVVGGVAAVAVALAATPASAHVTVTPSETAAGAYTVLTVSVPHGCDGAATTKVSVRIPEDILAVTPSVNPGWTPQKTMATLATPVKDSHGNEITERVAEVVYTAKTPLPDDLRDTFQLSLQLPETPGKTLVFPAVQTCEQGETAWVQVPESGQKADDLEHPAPSFVVTEAKPEDDDAQTGSATDNAAGNNAATANTSADTAAAAGDDSTSALTWLALGLGALGFVFGALSLVRPGLLRPRPATPDTVGPSEDAS